MATILTKESHYEATKGAFLSALEAADNNIYARFVAGGGGRGKQGAWSVKM